MEFESQVSRATSDSVREGEPAMYLLNSISHVFDGLCVR